MKYMEKTTCHKLLNVTPHVQSHAIFTSFQRREPSINEKITLNQRKDRTEKQINIK